MPCPLGWITPRFSHLTQRWQDWFGARFDILIYDLLGIGLTSKIMIIFIEAFFPIAVNTALGIPLH